MCFERPKKKSIKPTQCRSSVIQTTHHDLALNNQSKQRHVASIVHYPIKTPPRAFYCALPNQTRPRFSIVHFAAQEKKKLKSNVFYNSSPYGARVINHLLYGYLTKTYFILDIDECAKDTDNCHADSTCTNTKGSFHCSCRHGYSGDGINCVGKYTCANKYILLLLIKNP